MIIPYVSIGACLLFFLLCLGVKGADRAGVTEFRVGRFKGLFRRPNLRHAFIGFIVVIVSIALVAFGWNAYYHTLKTNLISDDTVIKR